MSRHLTRARPSAGYLGVTALSRRDTDRVRPMPPHSAHTRPLSARPLLRQTLCPRETPIPTSPTPRYFSFPLATSRFSASPRPLHSAQGLGASRRSALPYGSALSSPYGTPLIRWSGCRHRPLARFGFASDAFPDRRFAPEHRSTGRPLARTSRWRVAQAARLSRVGQGVSSLASGWILTASGALPAVSTSVPELFVPIAS